MAGSRRVAVGGTRAPKLLEPYHQAARVVAFGNDALFAWPKAASIAERTTNAARQEGSRHLGEKRLGHVSTEAFVPRPAEDERLALGRVLAVGVELVWSL